MPLPEGTIKVAYPGQNPRELKSQLFEDIEPALAYARNYRSYLVFELINTHNGYFRWKLLPYGKSRQYTMFLGISQALTQRNVTIAAAVVGLLIILRPAS